ncbi:hypothetical protein BDZ94DRAFT_698286 [Collybia nuda]|uniref:Uncharacterized protein n=1 Tax=Collybia nuda TaxID=64659 RepID=A0A9P5Y3I8_9AGAR|nr:hypothetical protein BDZ94DRAFT_698286 [Collybia nuda]
MGCGHDDHSDPPFGQWDPIASCELDSRKSFFFVQDSPCLDSETLVTYSAKVGTKPPNMAGPALGSESGHRYICGCLIHKAGYSRQLVVPFLLASIVHPSLFHYQDPKPTQHTSPGPAITTVATCHKTFVVVLGYPNLLPAIHYREE